MRDIEESFLQAESLYGDYLRLSLLSELSYTSAESNGREIISSVNTVLVASTADAIVE